MAIQNLCVDEKGLMSRSSFWFSNVAFNQLNIGIHSTQVFRCLFHLLSSVVHLQAKLSGTLGSIYISTYI